MQFGTIYAIAGENIVLAITQYSTVFSQNLVYFGRKKIALGGIISRCMSGGCPRVLFLRYDDACTGFASCSYPRTASGRRGVEQCDPQPFCLPSASGCHSRALRPAVLPPGGEACAFHKTLSPAQSVLDSRDVHKELLVSSA